MTGFANVLDHGFVRLESHMGGDQAVLRAARVSYGKDDQAPDEARDKKLIKYLLSHDHGSPFEHAVFTFHVKLPIFVARQWIRHRMGSFNEISARYTEVKDEYYTPDRWRAQDIKNRQGSVSADLDHELLSDTMFLACESAIKSYDKLLKDGAAKEMARFVLPVNMYTQWYWTVNARSLMHFVRLRSDGHAQWETRQYSHVIAGMFEETMPWTFSAMHDEMKIDEKIGRRDYSEMREVLGIVEIRT